MENYEIIQYIRKAKQKSQKELAVAINSAVSTISRVENGAANEENTKSVCDELGLDFSKELILTKNIDFFVIPENITSIDLDFSFIYYLISKYKCKVYLVESKAGFTQKMLKLFFNNCWVALILEINDSFFIFHRHSKASVLYPMNEFLVNFGLNKQDNSIIYYVLINISRVVQSIYDHTISKDELASTLKDNSLIKIDVSSK